MQVIKSTLIFWTGLLVGCTSLSPEPTEGHDRDSLHGGQIGGHPNTVIIDFVGLNLLDRIGTNDDLSADNFSMRRAACAGMLIAPNLVLTAKHCLGPTVSLYALADYTVRFFNLTTAELDHQYAWRDLIVYSHPYQDIAFIQLPDHLDMPERVSLYLEPSAVRDLPVHMDGNVRYDADGVRIDRDVVTARTVLREWTYNRNVSGYNVHWSLEFPAFAQPGDSGGPVYTLQSDGSAFVYGVNSAAVGPQGNDVLSSCQQALHSTQPCIVRVADFRLITDWVAAVQACAATSQCSADVLRTQTLGYGGNVRLFLSPCPKGKIAVGHLSIEFSAPQRRSYTIVTSILEYYHLDLEPTDFLAAETGFKAQVTMPFGNSNSVWYMAYDAEVLSVAYPHELQITDAHVRYESCR